MKFIAILLFVLIVGAVAGNRVFLDFRTIIAEVNSVQSSWKAGHNHYFDGMDLEQIKGLMGALETPEHLKLPLREVEAVVDIPEEFSSAAQWPNCESIREVRDQSTCGSCWAFGAVEVISDRICIASDQKLQVRISAQDLLACCSSCGSGCNGGYTAFAFSYWKTTGIVTGWLYNTTDWCMPYSFKECDHHVVGKHEPCGSTQPTPKCKTTCANGYAGTYKSDRWFGESVYSVPAQAEKIQAEIMANGPVEASFSVYSDFLEYKSGVYQHTTGSFLGGHAVKIVGWGVQNGMAYWQVANSWNDDWGNKGFFRIRRGNNECEFQGQIVAGLPRLKV